MAYRRTRSYRRRSRRPAYRRSYSMYARPRRYTKPRRKARRQTYTTTGLKHGANRRGCVCPNVGPAEKWALAQVDPFNPRAYGGKIPDSNTVPSCSVALQDLVALPLTVATNTNCWAFLPRVQRGRMISANEGAASWTWPAGYGNTSTYTKGTDYVAAYELDRPVAHGIRISSSVPPTTAQGFVHIAIAYESFASPGLSTWPWPTTVAGLSNYQFYKRITLASLTQMPLVVVNKYMDETAFRYSDPGDIASPSGAGTGSFMTFHTFFSWGAILVAVEGVNSASPLNVEVLLHTEAIPKQSGAVTGTPAAVANSQVMGATSYMVANTGESYNYGERDTYLARAQAMFQQGIQQAGNYASEELNRRASDIAEGLFERGVAFALNQAFGGIGGVNDNPNRLALAN